MKKLIFAGIIFTGIILYFYSSEDVDRPDVVADDETSKDKTSGLEKGFENHENKIKKEAQSSVSSVDSPAPNKNSKKTNQWFGAQSAQKIESQEVETITLSNKAERELVLGKMYDEMMQKSANRCCNLASSELKKNPLFSSLAIMN